MSTDRGWVARGRAAALLVLLGVVLSVGASDAAPPPLRPERGNEPLPPRTGDSVEKPPETPGDGVLEIVPPPPPPPDVRRPPMSSGRPIEEGSKLERTLDLSFSPYHRRLRIPGTLVSTDADAGARLRGDVAETGFSLRGGGTIDGVRFGLGAGLSAPSGLRVEQPLGGAGAVRPGRAFGTPIEAFVGYAYGSPRGVRPFVELRASAAWLHVPARGEAPARSTPSAFGASIGARAGALVWINQYFFADVGVGLGFVGAERFMGSVGLGVPIPFSNL